jgi:hypothetical protein
MSGLDALRSVNFDWTRQLKSVWRDPIYHVPSLHQRPLDDIINYFAEKTRDPADVGDEPLGRVIVGPAGYGKTHLIGELRRRIWELGDWFVLLDFIGIKDFWSSVALGFLNSLQVRMPNGKTQSDQLMFQIARTLGIHQEFAGIARRQAGEPRDLMVEQVRLFTRSLARRYPEGTRQHRDVVTALVLLISDDLDYQSIAHCWLQGMKRDLDEVGHFGFVGENSPMKVVQGLSWVMSIAAPTLIAVDQIDGIVTASNSLARVANGGAKREQEEAQSIVDALAEGLMDLHEKKCRAVTVVSCLEATWKVLEDKTTVAVTDRYGSPANLHALPNSDVAKGLVAARLGQAYSASDFRPPYPTWPFAEAAFESAVGFSPRQLLKSCDKHRQRCLAQGKINECLTFDVEEQQPAQNKSEMNGLDRTFERESKAAAVEGLMSIEGEDQLRELLDGTLRLFAKHLDLPDDIDVDVHRDVDQKRPSLHGRLSFIFRSDGDREHHYCFRILGHTNAIAFQSRLKAAMTASGIDTALRFRHLFILRRGVVPSGPKTSALVTQFKSAGGKIIAPVDEDLRAFIALRTMAESNSLDFDNWLRTRRPLFDTSLFKAAGLCPPPFLSSQPGGSPRPSGPALPPGRGPRPSGPTSLGTALPENEGQSSDRKGAPVTDRTSGAVPRRDGTPARNLQEPANSSRQISMGRRFERGAVSNPVTLAAELLPRHVAVLAGSGSGKTVLLRRVIEEAALLNIPAIVLDINNDLSRLGDPWPTRPDGFSDEDASKAKTYGDRADVIIWTPGVSSGNPISLKLLPDFAAIGESEDERAQAVEMARETLTPYLGGTGQRAQLKKGVLADALRAFAKSGGGSLDDLIDLLSELPEEISKISNAPKLASEIANQFLAAIATNPLLQSTGPSLDPQRLFHGGNGQTRISVINLAGLASDEARQGFVNQLQMALFTWIKQNPSPTGRLYALDEAQNFAPSQAGTACKASARSLVAQARKYGLGMIFATQLPRGIDNAIISNCTTHIYGRMSSPATIQATQELMAAKGGAAEDIARLTRGEFYFSTDGIDRPIKVRTPLCLSWHPPNPPTADEVVAKARAKRG